MLKTIPPSTASPTLASESTEMALASTVVVASRTIAPAPASLDFAAVTIEEALVSTDVVASKTVTSVPPANLESTLEVNKVDPSLTDVSSS
ncbi:hypothetical protein V6N13_030633 [Hibiscus sabdariffa]|uniref:Secreted protein n=1 Tax=Hibiscus sabdariffa TaxID=183260 RepID=A0ABR2D5S5_9ROSI